MPEKFKLSKKFNTQYQHPSKQKKRLNLETLFFKHWAFFTFPIYARKEFLSIVETNHEFCRHARILSRRICGAKTAAENIALGRIQKQTLYDNMKGKDYPVFKIC